MARILIGDIKGLAANIHVRYSASADGTGFTETPQADSKYMGVYTGLSATAPTDKATYNWVQTIGEPGSGWEVRHPQLPVLGDMTVGTNKMIFMVPFDMTIIGVQAKVLTAPTGASLIIDINKNGTTLYTTQANRPTIAAGETEVVAALPDVVSLSEDDIISIDIDQVGSTVAGANLVVDLECEV